MRITIKASGPNITRWLDIEQVILGLSTGLHEPDHNVASVTEKNDKGLTGLPAENVSLHMHRFMKLFEKESTNVVLIGTLIPKVQNKYPWAWLLSRTWLDSSLDLVVL